MIVKYLVNIFLIFLISITCISCSNENESSNNSITNDTTGNGVHYMDVINPLSSILYDYENPNYSYSSINCSSNIKYVLDGESTYKLISNFDNILLYYVNSSVSENINLDMTDALYIEVSYKYISRKNPSNDGTGYFYVLKNGMLVFIDNNKAMTYYSKTCELDYDNIKNEIMKGDLLTE